MQSMFLDFISAMADLAVSSVKRARAASRQSPRLKGEKSELVTCDVGVELQVHVEDAGDADGALEALQTEPRHLLTLLIRLQPDAEGRQAGRPAQLPTRLVNWGSGGGRQLTLNMGLTCSEWVALVKGAAAWEAASMRLFAAADICSVSRFHNRRRSRSEATPGRLAPAPGPPPA